MHEYTFILIQIKIKNNDQGGLIQSTKHNILLVKRSMENLFR